MLSHAAVPPLSSSNGPHPYLHLPASTWTDAKHLKWVVLGTRLCRPPSCPQTMDKLVSFFLLGGFGVLLPSPARYPPPRNDGSPPVWEALSPSDPPVGGWTPLPTKPLTGTYRYQYYYAELMAGQLLAVRCPKIWDRRGGYRTTPKWGIKPPPTPFLAIFDPWGGFMPPRGGFIPTFAKVVLSAYRGGFIPLFGHWGGGGLSILSGGFIPHFW